MSGAQEWDTLLDPDERIVWQGQPSTRVQIEFNSVFEVLFMMVWGGIPLFAVIASPQSLLLGVPALFLGIALYFFIGQHFWAAFQRSRTFYTLTDKRAFIGHRGLTGRKLDSFPITPDTNLQLKEGRRNAVWFSAREGKQMFSNRREKEIGFERLDDPRGVYQLLRSVQRGDA
ncbi:hypothetical protein KUV51_01135 [Tateyamaria omphalii]|uniref:hypothetical protein n=1 Tax=Tateyamaria omphalii TaxID=299262 RepID=UPI001C996FEA|nr:hypothetical protein [Tateyamaria omphalii]MBY5931586.1 hypothetical protein [Tateyamaria omphalii]